MSYAERGRRGAEVRWGPARKAYFADLTPEQRQVVLALIDAQRNANKALKNGAVDE
jgi:hypothetical protein